MNRILQMAAALVCLVLCVQAPAMSRYERLVEFVAGCEMLSEAVTMPAVRKAEAMRWLSAHTGVSAAQAVAQLEGYKNRPGDWRKLLDAVRVRLDRPFEEQLQGGQPGKH